MVEALIFVYSRKIRGLSIAEAVNPLKLLLSVLSMNNVVLLRVTKEKLPAGLVVGGLVKGKIVNEKGTFL